MNLLVKDDRGRELSFTGPPRRVVSLVPSDTLNVAAIGAGEALVGRTDYCDDPATLVQTVPTVGGTKNPNLEAVCDLRPDLVLANQEENTRGDLEELIRRGLRVLIVFPKTVAEGLHTLARLVRIFSLEREAKPIIKAAYDALRGVESTTLSPRVRVFCPIWMDPLMTIHGDTFISDMLRLCGADNVFRDRTRRYPLSADVRTGKPLPPEKVEGRDVRYPRVSFEEVRLANPELVLLPDEPHPFSEEDANVFRKLLPHLRPDRVVRTKGKDLCWYGAQSVEGIGRVRRLVAQSASAQQRNPVE